MGDLDRIEWRLLATDLTTQLAILPSAQGHLLFEFQEPGFGELRIPMDSTAAAQITEGMFAMCYYRGAARGGFFIDNIKETPASEAEGEGRWMSISGRGPLALLDEVIVWKDSTGESTRTFTASTKASVLVTLINERLARGGWVQFNFDFSATLDSNSVTWTDSENLEIAVGHTLLDVLRDFASTGAMEFSITFVGSVWTLHAYKNGIGTNKSTTQFFRIGTNCQEVSEDELGGTEIRNSYLIKFRDGYTVASDATSITNRRRREKFLNLEVAQSGDSAQTFASAKLSQTKDPKTSISVRVYDGIAPFLFVDYEMGDTITLDRFGNEVSYRVLGIQADFNGDDYSNVVVELNSLVYENDLRMNRDLDWLLKQWNTAKDANQQEVKDWLGFGQPNGEIYALHYLNNYLYVGGNFTQITGGITASFIARYNVVTGIWEAMGTTIASTVYNITDVAGDIYATTDLLVYSWSGSSWGLQGTSDTKIKSITTDGADLYVSFAAAAVINSVSIASKVAKYTGSWSAVGASQTRIPYTLTFWNGVLYGVWGSAGEGDLRKFTAGAWSNVYSSATDSLRGLVAVGNYLYISTFVTSSGSVIRWDGTTAVTVGAITGMVDDDTTNNHFAMAAFLSDVFYGSHYTTIDTVAGFGGIGRYSGGLWSNLNNGLSMAVSGGNDDRINAIVVIGDDVYVGGLFTTAGGKPISNLAVWITDFQSLINHLQHDNQFDLGSAIHQATAAAITDAGEMGFWDAVTGLLRKITWANIKATLKAAIKLDEWAAPTDVTTLNASTSTHGLLIKATAPSSGVRNIVAIDNGETVYKNAALIDSTNPANIGTAAPGTSLLAARRDHVHAGSYLNLSNRPVAETQTDDIYRVDSPGGASAFVGTIATLPGGAVLTYNVTSGQEGAMVPTATTQLGKMILYNTTRGNFARISNCVTGTNTITLTANVPVGWAVTDVITIASSIVSGGGFSWVDIEIGSGPINKLYMFMRLHIASATAGDATYLHPWETYSITKTIQLDTQIANAGITYRYMDIIKINSNIFSLMWTGTPSKVIIREAGYLE